MAFPVPASDGPTRVSRPRCGRCSGDMLLGDDSEAGPFWSCLACGGVQYASALFPSSAPGKARPPTGPTSTPRAPAEGSGVPGHKSLLTRREVAVRAKTSPSHVWVAIASGALPATRVRVHRGRKPILLVKREDADVWAASLHYSIPCAHCGGTIMLDKRRAGYAARRYCGPTCYRAAQATRRKDACIS